MKNFTISLGIGLNQLIMEYFVVLEPEVERSWSVRLKHSIGLKGAVK